MTPQSLKDPRAEKAAGKRKRTARSKADVTSPIAQLPFVCATPEDKEHPRCFWCTTPSTDYSTEPENYAADCATGDSYGLAALRYMRDHDGAPLLGYAVLDMIRRKRVAGSPDPDGIVVGFCTTIACAAIAGADEAFLKWLEQHYRDGAERLKGTS